MARKTPQISINNLGLYLGANPVRRRAIITDQKYPTEPPVTMPCTFTSSLVQYFSSRDPHVLYDAADALRGAPTGSEREASDNVRTAEAMENFVDILDLLPIDDCEVLSFDSLDFGPVMMSGVAVGVHPEFMVRHTRGGRECIGALKFHWSENQECAFEGSSGLCVATVLYQYLIDFPLTEYTPDPRVCIAIDLFGKAAWSAPASNHCLKTDLEAACEEIALHWEGLTDSMTGSKATLQWSLEEPAVRVRSGDHLNQLLDELDQKYSKFSPVAVCLCAHGCEVDVLVGDRQSFISIEVLGTGKRFICLGDRKAYMTLSYLGLGEHEGECEGRNLFPKHLLRPVVREFFETGGLSNDIKWEEFLNGKYISSSPDFSYPEDW